MVRDIWDEVCAVLDFVEAASCSNVSSEVLRPGDPRVNAKRVRDGKLPLYETRVLTVDPLDSRRKLPSLSGHHASPRMHLRRGHVRRLRDRTVWVNSSVVGDPSKGVVRKSYQLRRPNFGGVEAG